MTQYWLGDPHFGHIKVANIRGFATTDEHDEYLIHQLSQLKPDDTVYFVGDLSSGKPDAAERALEIISEFDFIKHLFAGNHDGVSSIHKTGWKEQRRYLEVFDSVRDFGRIALEREMVLMSHFPYAAIGDGDGRAKPARYLAFRLPDVGHPMIHAHTHQSHPFSLMREDTITKIELDGYDLNSMCVSWDARRGLTTEQDVVKWLEVRSLVKRQQETERVRNYWDAFPKPSV